jgi:nuclear pore complex protein Nup155
MGIRQKMNELNHTIQEELDVAVIQDDLLRRLREDERVSPAKKEKLLRELDSNLLSLSDVGDPLLSLEHPADILQLFNRFADPYGYMDICLAIFQGADYRGVNEIRKCWEQLISSIHTTAESSSQGRPYELVADTIRRLGHRFGNSEYIFPPSVSPASSHTSPIPVVM